MLLNLMEVKFIASVSHDYDEKRELASGFASANPLYFTNLPFLLSSFFKNSKSKMINKIYSKKIICKCLANFEYLKTGLNRFASRTLLNDISICSAIIPQLCRLSIGIIDLFCSWLTNKKREHG